MPLFDRDALPWEAVAVDTPRGPVRVRRWVPAGATSAVVMVGGVGGGFDTPARDLYPRLAEDLAASGIGTLRVRFRDPRALLEAVHDLRAGIAALAGTGVDQVALVGHSFGGAVVLRAALEEPVVAAVVTLATQSHGTEGVERLDRPLLLVHGDADPVLPSRASVDVARRAGERARLEVLAGAGHDLVEEREAVRMLVAGWLLAALSPSPHPDP